MSDELHAAYAGTDFWVEDAPAGPFRIRCGERCQALDCLLEEHGLNGWAYVTACNPGSNLRPAEENAGRMRELEARVSALPAVVIYHGQGVGPRGTWPPEPSLLLLGITEGEALALGAAFGQNAIVVGRHGECARLAWPNPAKQGT